MRRAVIALLLGGSLAWTSPAAAKDFRPGDLRLCGAGRCVALKDQAGLDGISAFYYGRKAPARTRRPAHRAPYYELRFRGGYVTGIVATTVLNRFLSYGVNTGQFAAGVWYRMPTRATGMLRRAAAQLPPLHLTASALRRSR